MSSFHLEDLPPGTAKEAQIYCLGGGAEGCKSKAVVTDLPDVGVTAILRAILSIVGRGDQKWIVSGAV